MSRWTVDRVTIRAITPARAMSPKVLRVGWVRKSVAHGISVKAQAPRAAISATGLS